MGRKSAAMAACYPAFERPWWTAYTFKTLVDQWSANLWRMERSPDPRQSRLGVTAYLQGDPAGSSEHPFSGGSSSAAGNCTAAVAAAVAQRELCCVPAAVR